MSHQTATQTNVLVSQEHFPETASGPRRLLRVLSFRESSALYIWVLIFLIFAVLVPDTFLTATTWRSLIDTQVVTCLVAVGLCIPLAAGVFDLSIGMAVGTGSMVASVLLVNAGLSAPVAVFAALLCGAAIGLINGLVVTLLNVDSFIATLGMQAVLIALVLGISGGQQVLGLPRSFQDIAANQFLGITYPVYIMLIVAVTLWYLLERTPLGRRFYATGGNPDAARLAGVPTKKLIVLALVISATVASFAGVLLAARLGTGDPTVGPEYLLPAFTAVFLGSTQFRSGRFNIWGTVVAVYVLATGVKGLQLAGAPVWLPYLFNGVVLIAAVALSKIQARARTTGASDRRRSRRSPAQRSTAA